METVIRVAGYITAIGGALGAIYKWVVEPLKKAIAAQSNRFDKIDEKMDRLCEDIKQTNDDIADVLGDRLTQAHDDFMRLGWCTAADKKRFCDMHQRYKARGHNHLVEKYEEDLLGLPEMPPKTE